MTGAREGTATVMIVDGHAYAYRAFHAIRGLSGPDGQPTNAIFGFVKALTHLRARYKPTHLVVVWDGGLAAERTELLPEYKAQRPPMPQALACQLDQIVAWLEASGIPSHYQDGVEADDWIATLARECVAGGARVLIASSDKDFMQLVSPQVGLVNPNDKSGEVWTASQVRAKTGVEPEQVVDWLSLVGDAVDNIPGVPGVGSKTAANLLRQFGSWQALRERLDQVESSRLRQELCQAVELVERNRRMIGLNARVPGDAFIARTETRPADNQRLRELYGRWGFGSLRRALDETAARQGELFEVGLGWQDG